MDSNNTAHLTMAKAFFGTNHPLFNMFNISVGAVSDGHAEMTMPFSEQLSDRKGSLHRGALVTLLDTTCGLSIFSSLRSLEPIATIDLRVDFLRRIPSAVGLKAIVDCIGRTERLQKTVVSYWLLSLVLSQSARWDPLLTAMKREASDMSIVNQMSAETPPLKLCDEPFVDFLGFREEMQHGEIQYFMDFRDSHIGNPMIGTFHGGILASFGEVAAAAYLARQRGDNELPLCSTMTFDYLRPAFIGTLQAVPSIVRAGRRITTVSVQLLLDGKLVCIGRFLFTVSSK